MDVSNFIELNEYEEDADMNHVFNKVSSFYSKDHITFEKKMCTVIINKIVGPNQVSIQVAEKEIDMSPYVDHTDSH